MITPEVWGKRMSPQVEFSRRPSFDVEPIPPEDVLTALDLKDAPRAVQRSVGGSIWGRIDGGRMILEQRTIDLPKTGAVNILDFDDCLMSASGWHAREQELVVSDQRLQRQGAAITHDEAKGIYEKSKIMVPGFAEQERRYTPWLNLILLSRLADAKRADPGIEGTQKAREEVLEWSEIIRKQVEAYGERVLKAYSVDPIIKEIFMGNPPGDFLHHGFVQYVLSRTTSQDTRVIATRGKIEGPLGQVYKVHSSGLMRQRSVPGQAIDVAIYSNDIKGEALQALLAYLPDVRGRHVRIYDDNPDEILPYLGVVRSLAARNIEIVHVSHPDAKRKGKSVEAAPTLQHMVGDVELKHYSLLSMPSAVSV